MDPNQQNQKKDKGSDSNNTRNQGLVFGPWRASSHSHWPVQGKSGNKPFLFGPNVTTEFLELSPQGYISSLGISCH